MGGEGLDAKRFLHIPLTFGGQNENDEVDFIFFFVLKPKVRHMVAESFGAHFGKGSATGSHARASAASLRRATPGYQPS